MRRRQGKTPWISSSGRCFGRVRRRPPFKLPRGLPFASSVPIGGARATFSRSAGLVSRGAPQEYHE